MVYLLHCQRLVFRESFDLAAMFPLKGSSASPSFAFLPTHRWRKLPPPPFVERKPERRRASCRDRCRHLSRGLQRSRCTHSLLYGQSRVFCVCLRFSGLLRFSYLLFCILQSRVLLIIRLSSVLQSRSSHDFQYQCDEKTVGGRIWMGVSSSRCP